MIHLGVNIDHVATVRQARQGVEPDPVAAATLAELGGANGITVHLREDRRHIQERDVRLLRETVQGTLNLEMAVDEAITDFACAIQPDQICLVPERREELTTEGGLRIAANDARLRRCIDRLQEAGCLVSLFIEPDPATVDIAADLGADAIELHTGAWAESWNNVRGRHGLAAVDGQLTRLERAAERAAELGLRLHAGHGITYANVGALLHLPLLRELNIGHSIVSRAMLVGMERAVADMRHLINSPT
ncbi:MAG: pyridoxine 5'-phosphate synthase [Planctomycetota bacterium]